MRSNEMQNWNIMKGYDTDTDKCYMLDYQLKGVDDTWIHDRWCVCWWYFIFVTDRDGLSLVDLEPTGGTGRVWLSHSPGQVSTQLRLVHTSWRSVRDLPASLVSKFSLLIFPTHHPILSLQLNLIYNYILLQKYTLWLPNALAMMIVPWLVGVNY